MEIISNPKATYNAQELKKFAKKHYFFKDFAFSVAVGRFSLFLPCHFSRIRLRLNPSEEFRGKNRVFFGKSNFVTKN